MLKAQINSHNKKLLTLFAVLGITLNVPSFSEESKTSSLSSEQKAEVELVVRDVLKKDPDLVEASLRAGMEKKEAAAREEAKKAVKAEHKALFEDSKDPILGNPNGTVSMVVFMDPYCGYCRKFQAVLLGLVKERKDLKVVYKAYPIMSNESKQAAEEEMAANDMGRFQDYHEAIYESSVRSRKERFALAEKNKIDLAKLKDNIPGISKSAGAAAVEKRLEGNMKLGRKLGINGTPAFIIGGELHPGMVGKEELIELINAQAKK